MSAYPNTWASLQQQQLEALDCERPAWYDQLVLNQLMYVLNERERNSMTDEVAEQVFKIGCAAARELMHIRYLVGIQALTRAIDNVQHMSYTCDTGQPQPDGAGKRMTLSLRKHPVAAIHRNFFNPWTLDHQAASTLQELHGDEAMASLVETIGAGCGEILIRDTLLQLKQIAAGGQHPVETLEVSVTHLIIHLNRLSNDIARDTCRGVGNFIVCSAEHAKAIAAKLTPMGAYVEEWGVHQSHNLCKLVGIANNHTRVYESPLFDDEILVGYKGYHCNDVDTGYILAPFVPTVVDMNESQTLHPATKFGSLCGSWTGPADTPENLFRNDAYVRMVKVKLIDVDGE